MINFTFTLYREYPFRLLDWGCRDSNLENAIQSSIELLNDPAMIDNDYDRYIHNLALRKLAKKQYMVDTSEESANRLTVLINLDEDELKELNHIHRLR